MNALDIIIIIVFALCIIRGIFQGLLQGISSLAALLVGLFLAKRYYLATTAFLIKIHIPDANGIVGYLVVFLIFFVGIKLIFFLLAKLTKTAGLSILDRALGSLLGFIKGGLYILILVVILQAVMPPGSAILTHSKILPHYRKVIVKVHALVPSDLNFRPAKTAKEKQ
ncbi:MAG: CvpA family protein [Syntrophaceae bacterium]